MVQPIAVGGVDHRCPLSSSQGSEFSIASVEIDVNKNLWKIGVLTIFSLWQFNTLDHFRCAIENFSVEAVADTRLTTWLQMTAILGLDVPGAINQHRSRIECFLQKSDGFLPALDRWATRPPIGNDGDVSIHDIAAHSAAFIRLKRANSALAASLKASPMNLSGQLLMLP